MSEYYDIEKPFSRENWNKLIRDINDFFTAPPVGCPSIEPLEEVDPEHIWTVKDVEDVRDKLKEACPDHTFDEELEIWKTGIIDEIEEKIGQWCGCEPTEIVLADESRRFCGGSERGGGESCCDLDNPELVTIQSVIDGMSVGPSGVYGRVWRVYSSTDGTLGSLIANGPVHCDGHIVFLSENPAHLATGCVSFTFCSGCSEWTAEIIAEWQAENQHLLDGPNHTTTLKISGGWRPCEEGEDGWWSP